jgi:rhomboid protease GluP
MSFGFSPKHLQVLRSAELTQNQTYVIALETAKKLGWSIGYLSPGGFKAYTRFSFTWWGEELEIKIAEGNIQLKSECTGSQLLDWGKNKANIEEFIKTFHSVSNEIKDEDLDLRFTELQNDFISEEEAVAGESPISGKGRLTGVFSMFKPTKGYFITPILVLLNIALFVIMLVSGVHALLPDNESLLLWGANFGPLTLNGEWWRLLSSCFIHIGVFHLLMNMYALIYIGSMLEPYLGKARFLSAYLLAGIAGSSASLFWNDFIISAGASGAIFGMYGVFLAMLTTNLIDKSARGSLLISIGIFVGYNLLNGFKPGIDNAAHIGGLLCGLLIGYSFYPSLKSPKNAILKPGTIALLALLVVSSSFAVLSTSSPDMNKYQEGIEKFIAMEEQALGIFSLPEDTIDEKYLWELQNGIHQWKECRKLLEDLDTLNLPSPMKTRNAKLQLYCDLRIKSFDAMYNAILLNTDEYNGEIEEYNTQLATILSELGAQ